MLNSWSFEPSSNKSVENLDPSIPIPSEDHNASHGHTAAEHPSVFAPAPSVDPWSNSEFLRQFPNFTDTTLPNPLISRVCTPLHVNQILFFGLFQTHFRPLSRCPSRKSSQRSPLSLLSAAVVKLSSRFRSDRSLIDLICPKTHYLPHQSTSDRFLDFAFCLAPSFARARRTGLKSPPFPQFPQISFFDFFLTPLLL